MKRCSKCHKTLPFNCFHKDGDGVTARCKVCARRAALAWNKANPDKHKAKLKKWFSENKQRRKEYDEKYKDRRKLFRKINHETLRLEAIAKYGGRCACCEETEKHFLSIDHKNNDGNVHRKTLGAGRIYYWLKANSYPDTFQLLCMNCNWGKHRNGGICPHVSMAAMK